MSAPGSRVDPSRLFLVLGRSRTGSNMLIHMLRQHPDVSCAGEVIADATEDSWPPLLSEIEAAGTAWSGFKAFYYHARDAPRLWARLEDDRRIPVVHMRRRNMLRAVVSREIADQTGQWALLDREAPVAKSRVLLDPGKLERTFTATEAQEARFAERFAAHPLVSIEYEDMAASPAAAYDAVIEVLGLPAAEAIPRTSRQNPEPLAELVENLPELRRHFADSRWSELFVEGEAGPQSSGPHRAPAP